VDDKPILHLSMVVGSPLVDRDGERVGRVDDLIVRLGDSDYPPLTGLKARIAGRELFVPIARVASIEAGRVTLAGSQIDLGRFERRPGEVLLAKDVLDRQLINVDGARLVRANEIELTQVDGRWRVAGVDTTPRGALRRLLPRRLAPRVPSATFLDWASVEPFVGHVPTVRLRVPHPKLAQLHPAQLADLVEAASHSEGEEIIEAVGADRELEADVFEELDRHHQLEFLRERSDSEAAAVLSEMQPDDAADLMGGLEEERRAALLEQVPWSSRRKLRVLLGHDPATAGGLMSTEFLCLGERSSVAEALRRVRAADLPDQTLGTVYVQDPEKRLAGAVTLPELLRHEPDEQLGALVEPCPVLLAPDADFDEVAREMADYNLVSAPVVDEDGAMLGVITVDDVLEAMVPSGWRRRFGLLAGD
jgi:CBS domain-containing protein